MNKWFSKSIVSKIREAIDKYDMIKPGDKILVGVSGGKDSSILFYALTLLKKYGIYDFEVTGITVDHGLIDQLAPYKSFCQNHEMRLIIHHEHYAIKLSEESEYAPCYTCSRLRKGIIKRYALEKGYNKIALGHTKDDLVETFMMNIIAHGKIGSISPASIVEEGIQMIRPLVFVDEKEIIKAVKHLEIPLMSDVCTFSHGRLRSQSERLIEQIELTVPDFSDKVIQALSRVD
ncbi:MAG TPA: hypothetical protein DCS67_00640 [Clostridiales bacterium UBA8960]|jgi:tRNA(Ile)-lysidine synthetase-like protein|nr:hypothetical protein [Clostridiales bacterium UBA8960]